MDNPLIGPPSQVRAYYCMSWSCTGFLCSDPFLYETFYLLFRRLAPFPLVLGCSRPLVGVKALRSSRNYPIQSFPRPLKQPAPPTNSPNITHFGSLVSSMCATNSARRIHLLRIIALILSLPVFIRCPDRKSGGKCDFLSSTDMASQKAVVGLARHVVMARARALRDAAIQHGLEYLGS